MSYHQDDGKKPVYHGHATSGCLMIILGIFVAILIATLTVFGVSTIGAIGHGGQLTIVHTAPGSSSGSW